MHITHGKSNTRLYYIYKHILARCFNKNDKRYRNYGGRGITICEEWKKDFMNFYNWALNNGYKDNLTIDRIDVNGNYEPLNCKWSTIAEQNNNTTRTICITHNGETHTISQWAKKIGISYGTFARRIYRHGVIDKAFRKEWSYD